MPELPIITSIYFDPTTDFGFKKLFGEEANKDLLFPKRKRHQLQTRFDKWCYFLKNLEDFNSIPYILNEPLFMKAFDVAKLSKMDPDDYVLYQISKSKKYDMEILEEEAEKRGLERGFAKGMEKGIEKGKIEGILEEKERNEVNSVVRLQNKGLVPLQISDLLNISLERVQEIIQKNVLNAADK